MTGGQGNVSGVFQNYSYTLTTSNINTYNYFIFILITTGMNCINYGNCNSVTIPSNTIILCDQTTYGGIRGQSVSGSNGTYDGTYGFYLIPKQISQQTISFSTRSMLLARLYGLK